MQLSTTQQAIIRQTPQSTEMNLSIFQPRAVLKCKVNGTIAKGARTIPYNSVSSGSFHAVESGMTLLVGNTVGGSQYGKIRVKSITSTNIVVSENSQINWASVTDLTVLRYFEVWPVYPRIITDPANAEDVIFYKDYDIAYTDQNEVLGALVTAGSHRACWAGDSLYFSASGTTHLVPGTTMTYDWAFEGGTSITGSTSHTPGSVIFDTPGHYVTRLIVTGNNGSVDTTYRYVSVYNRPGTGNFLPIKNWSVATLGGSRGEGGNRAAIHVVNEDANIDDGLPVVIFTDDWYGATNISFGGNATNSSKIFFSGHVINSSIKLNYQSSSVDFDIGNITEIMRITETYAISLEATASPSKWFQVANLDGRKAIYHYLRWHSTVLYLADLEFVGTDQYIQFFDTDRQSIYDAIDNYMRNTLMGNFTSDRQGKLWAEVGTAFYSYPVASFPPVMEINREDWMSEPNITESLNDTVSFIEMGGVAYSGTGTGTYNAYLSQAPGATPNGRGSPDNKPGLAISNQAHLNRISGNMLASANSKYPTIEMEMSRAFRNLDIAPIESVSINIGATDTAQGIVIYSPYTIEGIDWNYDVEKKLLYPSISYKELVTGISGETITIPDLPDNGGFGGGGFGGFGGINLPIFTIPPSSYNPTYTWVINIPTVGGVPGPRMNLNHMATSISAYCVGGTSVTFNIESRNTIGTPGTDISSTEIVAPTTGVEGTIDSPILLVGSWLWLDITGVSGAVTKFVVTLGVL